MKTESPEENRKLSVLLVEYQNAVQLYNTVLSVGYQRMLALFALHGGLLAAIFTLENRWAQFTVALVGLLFALFTVATIEHFIQIYLLRLFQARDIESHINSLADGVLTTFSRIHELFLHQARRGSIRFGHLPNSDTLPSGFFGTFIHQQKVFVIERALGAFVIVLWVVIASSKLAEAMR